MKTFAQIVKTYKLMEANHGNAEIQRRYKSVVTNIKNFNKGLVTSKQAIGANGEMTKFYNKAGNLLQEVYLISDRNGVELVLAKYDGKGI